MKVAHKADLSVSTSEIEQVERLVSKMVDG